MKQRYEKDLSERSDRYPNPLELRIEMVRSTRKFLTATLSSLSSITDRHGTAGGGSDFDLPYNQTTKRFNTKRGEKHRLTINIYFLIGSQDMKRSYPEDLIAIQTLSKESRWRGRPGFS